jgi:hypothetical protein
MTRTIRVSHFANLQEFGPMKTFTDPFANTLPITLRNSRSRRKMSSAPATPLVDASHTTGGWKSLDTEHPTYVSACRRVDVDPWRFVPDEGDASVLPVPGLFSEVAACAGYAATRSEDLVDQIRIMIDAIGADEGPADHPSGDGPPVRYGASHSQRHRELRVEPDSSERGRSVVTSAPDAT